MAVGTPVPFCKHRLVYFHLPTLPISGNILSFNVGSREAFQVPLADVSQTLLQGKTDVVLEFHVDDTSGANEVCGLPRYVDPKYL